MESCVPPGFRFHPTDEELVGYYLKKKVAAQKIDLNVIRDVDLYRIEPWDLQERCRIGYEEQNEWYFFSHKDKKYPTGTRTNRATIAGFWKATGRDKAVYDKMKLIGMRKTLVFYKGRAPNGQKTDWIMHEYRLETDENGPPQEEGWVVCRAFKKRATVQSKTIEGSWDSTYFYDEASPTSPYVTGPTKTLNNGGATSQQGHDEYLSSNFFCKQESNSHQRDPLHYMSAEPFLQLPDLESSSLPLLRRPLSSTVLISNHTDGFDNQDDNNCQQKDDPSHHLRKSKGRLEKVTDWRALDKFVASQLMSQNDVDDINQGDDVHEPVMINSGCDFGGGHDEREMSFLMENGCDEASNDLCGLLMSSSGE